jgi:tetratricopeptide (TPR) repeat protein
MASQTPPATENKDLDIGEMYTKTELFFERNKKAFTLGTVGLLAVVAGLLGYRKFVAEPRAQSAQEAIWKAQYYFEIDSLDLAINGDGAYPGFLEVASSYGSTPAGELANFYLGVCHHQKGEFETALNYYKEADLDDNVLSVMAEGNQGDVLVELGRADEALSHFEKAANMVRSDYTTPLFLMKAGILYAEKQDHRNAAKCFGRIVSDFPNSPDIQQARKYAAREQALSGQS